MANDVGVVGDTIGEGGAGGVGEGLGPVHPLFGRALLGSRQERLGDGTTTRALRT